MPFIHTTDTITHHIHGAHFTSYTAPSLGSDQLCVWQLHIPAGTTGQPHTVDHEEVLVITSGTPRATLDNHTTTLQPGEAILVPPGQTFHIDNPGTQPATAIVATTTGLQATLPDGTHLTPPWTR
jgi:mannose-6-phosphate isomerase-like protein (cupin superfamily)